MTGITQGTGIFRDNYSTAIKNHNFQSVCAFCIPYTSAEIKSDDSPSPITWINLPASNGTTRKKIIKKKSIAIKIEKKNVFIW